MLVCWRASALLGFSSLANAFNDNSTWLIPVNEHMIAFIFYLHKYNKLNNQHLSMSPKASSPTQHSPPTDHHHYPLHHFSTCVLYLVLLCSYSTMMIVQPRCYRNLHIIQRAKGMRPKSLPPILRYWFIVMLEKHSILHSGWAWCSCCGTSTTVSAQQTLQEQSVPVLLAAVLPCGVWVDLLLRTL